MLDGVIVELVTALDVSAAIANFPTAVSENVTGSDSALVAASVFISNVSEAATSSETVSSLVGFVVTIIENAGGIDSVLVEPSTFGAIVSETATALESSFPIGTFFVNINESAVAADQIPARLLWEIINNSQSTVWQNVKTQG